MVTVEDIKVKYPAIDAWQIGDSPKLASELADLIKKESKRPPADLSPLTSRKGLPRGLEAITLSLMARTFRFA